MSRFTPRATNQPCAIRSKYELLSSRYMDVDGLRIHYTSEGSGPPLVLLHGVMASLHTWDGWVEQLASSFRIIRIDLPGFGLSDHLTDPEHYSPEHSIALFDKLREAFGLERFHIAGNSLGGFMAWYYAVHHPDRVDKLILIDPIAYPQPLPPIMQFVALPGIGEIARVFAPRALVEQSVRQVYGDPRAIQKEIVDRYYELMMRAQNRYAMVETFRRIKQMSTDLSISAHIRKVRAPTLLMWGGKDRWVPPALIENWKRDLANIQVKLYPDAGHIPMEELPLETARDARAFLTEQPTRSAPAP
jgi:pimeloyl-ACP methyl ester carboxylesterase